MREDDLPAVSALLCECYRWLGKREHYTSDQVDFLVSRRGSLETVSLESSRQIYLVADLGGDIIGVVAVSGNEITKLYVAPAYHGKHIGARLFEAAEAAISSAGHERLALGAFPTAVAFYEAMGLTVTGSKPRRPGSAVTFSVFLMEKRLTKAGP